MADEDEIGGIGFVRCNPVISVLNTFVNASAHHRLKSSRAKVMCFLERYRG